MSCPAISVVSNGRQTVLLSDEWQQKKGWRQGDTVRNWYVETVADSQLTTDLPSACT